MTTAELTDKERQITEVRRECYFHTKYTGDDNMDVCAACKTKIRAIEEEA